jgi:hypothetical protein
MGVITCASVESIQLDPDEGGSTRMRGGVPAVCHVNSHRYDTAPQHSCLMVVEGCHYQLTLPAGYLGSSAIGAALIACVSRRLVRHTCRSGKLNVWEGLTEWFRDSIRLPVECERVCPGQLNPFATIYQ